MNREDIIRMAREADFKANVNEPYNVTNEWVFRFAALVASAERERFADECIDLVASYGGPVDLEAAIRARGSHD
jgi:hypothetical protein